ncbi:MAG: hypothetical protein ACPGQV_19800 [Alphaproteobacteria bacterium]
MANPLLPPPTIQPHQRGEFAGAALRCFCEMKALEIAARRISVHFQNAPPPIKPTPAMVIIESGICGNITESAKSTTAT